MTADQVLLAGATRVLTHLLKLSDSGNVNEDKLSSAPLPDDVMATHLYRIAQEAVNNAIKHGRANQIKIELLDAFEIIPLMVQNNGLAVSKARSFNDGIGLRIMRYRAKLIGGWLTFRSDAKGGTTVACAIHQPAALLEPSST